MRSKNKNSKIIPVIIAAVSVAVLALSLKLWVFNKKDVSTKSTTASVADQKTQKQEEQAESEGAKDTIVKNETQQSQPQTDKTVNPVITSATPSELDAIVNGIIEEDGDCTAQYTKDSTTFSRSSKGIANATNTVCYPIQTNASDFAVKGEWTVTLTYRSEKASGTSATYKFTVK